LLDKNEPFKAFPTQKSISVHGRLNGLKLGAYVGAKVGRLW